jgi:hypothetical protein
MRGEGVATPVLSLLRIGVGPRGGGGEEFALLPGFAASLVNLRLNFELASEVVGEDRGDHQIQLLPRA